MKTRLLRKLRREAKRYVKIVNELEHGRYAIINNDKEHNGIKIPTTYFNWQAAAGAFLPGDLHAWKKDLNDVIEQLPRARRYFIQSKIFNIRLERARTARRKARLKERKHLNKL